MLSACKSVVPHLLSTPPRSSTHGRPALASSKLHRAPRHTGVPHIRGPCCRSASQSSLATPLLSLTLSRLVLVFSRISHYLNFAYSTPSMLFYSLDSAFSTRCLLSTRTNPPWCLTSQVLKKTYVQLRKNLHMARTCRHKLRQKDEKAMRVKSTEAML